MMLIRNWRRVIRRAWSIRLMIIAAVLSAVEVGLSLIDARMLGLPEGVFAAGSAFITAAALIARLLAQSDLEEDRDADQV